MSTKPQVKAGIYGRQSLGKQKSIDEQTAECVADAEHEGWKVSKAHTYSDGVSASRFGTKARPDWDRLLADLEAGRFGVLVLWESSRGDRDAETWLGLLAKCRKRGVLIRVTSHGRTYDMHNARDWRTLAEDGVDNAYESEKTSMRLKRAMAAQARDGKPHGHCAYGYDRVYGIDERGKRYLVEQRPHPEHAAIVQDIIRRIGKGVPLSQIARELNHAGVPTPGGGTAWRTNTLRDIALRPDYIGVRELHGERFTAVWPALVTHEEHKQARVVLTDPKRRTNGSARPGRQLHMLSYQAMCGVCQQANLHARPPSTRGPRLYQCVAGCTSIQADDLDDFVIDLACQYLAAAPEIKKPANDAQVLDLRDEVAKLQERLDEWRDSGARGETSPASLARIEAQLTAEIAQAKKREVRATRPAILAELVEGAQGRPDIIEHRFRALNVAQQRQALAVLIEIRVGRAAHRGARGFDSSRVTHTWK